MEVLDVMTEKYIAYYRVSTKKQGASGLGLEAQKNILKNYNIVAEYCDIESGRNKKRVNLLKAIADCKEKEATLLVAKLDRLSRNVAFTMTLVDSGIKIIFADFPNMDIVTLATLAAVAQKEVEMISKRIKEALKARLARGLSNDRSKNITDKQRSKGGKKSGLVRREAGRAKTMTAYKTACVFRKDKKGYRVIAKALNSIGFKTIRGKMYSPQSVKNLFYLHKKNKG